MSRAAAREPTPDAPPGSTAAPDRSKPAADAQSERGRIPSTDPDRPDVPSRAPAAPRPGDIASNEIVPQRKPPVYRRPLFLVIAVLVFVAVVVAVVLWWLYARAHETTDDAFVAANNSSVSPMVAGHVLAVYVNDNEWVTRNRLLVKIDPRDLQEALNQAMAAQDAAEGQLEQARAQLEVARAQVSAAQADVKAAEASYAQAEADLKRYEALPPGAASRQQIDAAVAAARTTGANLEAARQKLAAAEAQVAFAQTQIKTQQAEVARARSAVANARLQLSYTDVTAPIDGLVTNRHVEVGDYLQTGQALLALVPQDLSNVFVTANFKETQLALMKPGQHATVHIDAYGKTYDAHVDSIQAGSGAAFSLLPPENATGNYVKVVQRVPVKVVFDRNPGVLLGPGMSVEVNVTVR